MPGQLTVSQQHHIPLYSTDHIISKRLKPRISVCDLESNKRWNRRIKIVLIIYVKKLYKKTINGKLFGETLSLAGIIILISSRIVKILVYEINYLGQIVP